MKSFLTLLTLFAIYSSSAQIYQPFPITEASWKIGRCWYFFPGGWYDELTVDMTGEDTLINSVTYKKLYITHHIVHGLIDSTYTRILGGMRELNRKILMVSEEFCLDTLERTIYDFNDYVVGDTILTNVLSNGPLSKVPHVVTTIDSVQVGTTWHRQFHLSDTSAFAGETWIEGVGSSWGLPYASYWTMTDNSYDLVCFNHLGTLRYRNLYPGYAFCTAPYPKIECEGTTIPSGCIASFSYSKQTDTVSFSGSSNHIGVTNWQWNFGDGATDTTPNPQHIYLQQGWHESCLTVTGIDSSGVNCASTFCDSIYISDGCIDSSLICPPGSLCCDAPLYEPVCGCDSVTYDNGCLASLWHGVLHFADGPCLITIREENNIFRSMKLLPNPAGEQLTIKIEVAEKGLLCIRVKNILGVAMLTSEQNIFRTGVHTVEMNLEKIPAGTYFAEVSMNGKISLRKFVRE